ncbi:PepSY domain-containing protein [Pseudomonas donghuensis]|uniref:PepSY domain-containing protein n=1 Tax=Pseudomonas donghuensis TaxID=1163398 RepID=UPI002E0F150A|nr:PepSY domain-containing protein [Pseudomonas donghuensis]
MKPMTTMFAGLALLGAMAATPVWAQQPGDDWKVDQTEAEATLKAAGYTRIIKIEAEEDHWEGEGIKQDGMKYEFNVDANSGKITKDEREY